MFIVVEIHDARTINITGAFSPLPPPSHLVVNTTDALKKGAEKNTKCCFDYAKNRLHMLMPLYMI
jgi:hypothetical protein